MKRFYFLFCIANTFSAVNNHATSPVWLTAGAITTAVIFALLFLNQR